MKLAFKNLIFLQWQLPLDGRLPRRKNSAKSWRPWTGIRTRLHAKSKPETCKNEFLILQPSWDCFRGSQVPNTVLSNTKCFAAARFKKWHEAFSRPQLMPQDLKTIWHSYPLSLPRNKIKSPPGIRKQHRRILKFCTKHLHRPPPVTRTFPRSTKQYNLHEKWGRFIFVTFILTIPIRGCPRMSTTNTIG